MKRRRRRRREPTPTPEDTSAWIHAMPYTAQLLVSEGGKNVGTLDGVGYMFDEPFSLEETLLDSFGSGRYTLVPIYDGKMHKAACVPVGNVHEHGIRRRPKDEPAPAVATADVNEGLLRNLEPVRDLAIEAMKITQSMNERRAERTRQYMETFRVLSQFVRDMQPPPPKPDRGRQIRTVVLPAITTGLLAVAADPRMANSPISNAVREMLTHIGTAASENAPPPAEAPGPATQKPARVRYQVPGAKTRRFRMPSQDAEKTTS